MVLRKIVKFYAMNGQRFKIEIFILLVVNVLKDAGFFYK